VYLRRARVLPIAALLSISAVIAAERPSDIALFRAIESNDLPAMNDYDTIAVEPSGAIDVVWSPVEIAVAGTFVEAAFVIERQRA